MWIQLEKQKYAKIVAAFEYIALWSTSILGTLQKVASKLKMLKTHSASNLPIERDDPKGITKTFYVLKFNINIRQVCVKSNVVKSAFACLKVEEKNLNYK